MKTEMLSDTAIMIDGTTFSVVGYPVLDNWGTDGGVAWYATAVHHDENGNATEIRIYWPVEPGQDSDWDAIDHDDIYVYSADQWLLDEVQAREV